MDNLLMEIFVIPCGYEHIIHVDEDASRVPCLERGKDPIHTSLKDSWGIRHPKEHALQLVMAIWSFECKLPAVLGLNPDVIVPISDVKSGEDCFAVQLFQDEVNPRHGVHVSLHPLVNVVIVLYKLKAPILFVDKEDRAAPWQFAVLDPPQCLILCYKAVPFLKFCSSERIDFVVQCIRCSRL